MDRYLSEFELYYFTGGVRFNTTGRCGGQIQVNYRNQWENVCQLGFPLKLKHKLCRELGCEGYSSSIDKSVKKSTVIPNNDHWVFYQKPDLCCI